MGHSNPAVLGKAVISGKLMASFFAYPWGGWTKGAEGETPLKPQSPATLTVTSTPTFNSTRSIVVSQAFCLPPTPERKKALISFSRVTLGRI